MSDALVKKNEIALGDAAKERQAPANWKKAFVILALQSCTGWISSEDVSRYIDRLRAEGEGEAADLLTSIFNKTRSKFEHGMMG